MSAKQFGTIHLIAGIIAILMSAFLFMLGASDLDRVERYLFDNPGRIFGAMMMLLTAYIGFLMGAWGILIGILAIIVGAFSRSSTVPI